MKKIVIVTACIFMLGIVSLASASYIEIDGFEFETIDFNTVGGIDPLVDYTNWTTGPGELDFINNYTGKNYSMIFYDNQKIEFTENPSDPDTSKVFYEDFFYYVEDYKETGDLFAFRLDPSQDYYSVKTGKSINDLLLYRNDSSALWGTILVGAPLKTTLGMTVESKLSKGDITSVSHITPVPEPATMLLFGTGLAGLAGVAARRRKK